VFGQTWIKEVPGHCLHALSHLFQLFFSAAEYVEWSGQLILLLFYPFRAFLFVAVVVDDEDGDSAFKDLLV
jgi:hypothetical protein